MQEIVIDFETRSRCDLKRSGAWRYAEDASTEVICLAYTVGNNEPELWVPGMPEPAWLRGGALLVAHNAMFEQAIWEKIMVPRYGWPPKPPECWRDTQASCGYKAAPLKLEKAADVLGLRHQKDMAGNRLLNQITKPDKKGAFNEDFEKYERVYEYCAQDVRAERELWHRLGPLPTDEQQLWELDQQINRRGVRLDVPAIHAAKAVVAQVEGKLLAEFSTLCPGLRPSQRDKFIEWLGAEGLHMPNMQAETVEAVLREEGLPEKARRALEIGSILSLASIKKLDAMLACVCADGRARGLLQYHSATTGRWAGRLFQPQNPPRGAYHADPESIIGAIMQRDAELLDMIYGDAMQAVSDALRPLMIAGEGRELACVDFSAIEAVVLACLAGETWKVDAFRRKVDIYCETASGMFGRKVTKETDPEGRQVGKVCELAFGFQGGVGAWRNFESSDRPDEEIDGYKTAWREKHPAIVAFWRGVEDASVGCVMTGKPRSYRGIEFALRDGYMTCRLPSGRLLWYNEPKIVWKPVPWDDDEERPALQYKAWRYGAWRTIDSYGGILTENIVQATARDILVHAMWACERENYPMILTVHDENLTEPRSGHADMDALIEIVTDPPEWAKDWPINAAGWIGQRYRKD